jgi:hypothetical protein
MEIESEDSRGEKNDYDLKDGFVVKDSSSSDDDYSVSVKRKFDKKDDDKDLQ